jgi:starch phosphorylase
MFKSLLPRIYTIICELNEHLCQNVWAKYPGDWDTLRAMSIIHEDNIYMARLAVVGSYSVNGVAQIHTDILKKHVMHQFHQYYPDKFNNKTNGITHRRWLLKANPQLAGAINQAIGTGWVSQPGELIGLAKYAEDEIFQDKLADIKRQNKIALANYIHDKYDINLDTESIFDVQIKRIHAYKRQILNAIHIMYLYNRLRENPNLAMTPRTFIFAGKAAPGYYLAKQTIKLINILASIINRDKTIQGKIKVVFLENYSVSLGELIVPAADVSEQISTASKEASGTGNMKFMMNGAVTIGTLDGANIEICDAVGEDNIIIFGLRAEQVLELYQQGGYNSWDVYNNDNQVKTVLNQLVNGFFPNEKEEFRPLYDYLLHNNDEFFVLKDFSAYAAAQIRLESAFVDTRRWLKMNVQNIAHSGIFSSDRTISQYAADIWKVRPVIIDK